MPLYLACRLPPPGVTALGTAAPRQPVWKLRPRLNQGFHRQRRTGGLSGGGGEQASKLV